MKKWLAFLAAALVILGMAGLAAAEEEALEVTSGCTLTLTGIKNPKNMTDRKFTTNAETKSVKNPSLTIQSKSPVYGLYLCFEKMPESYDVQADRGSGWETVASGGSFLHAWFPMQGETKIRVIAQGDRKQIMGFNEVYCFGEGRAPGWVQQWEDAPEKADILFVTAHPEEELLFLGGAIPYYVREKEASVALAVLCPVNTTRRAEMLNGLWSMGYRNYPFIGTFETATAKSAKGAYQKVDKKNGEEVVQGWLTEIIRRCRPEVIVGPDEQGEGNNGQRMMMADACVQCFSLAADENRFADSAGKYGAWQAKKVYLHLFGKEADQTVFDWDSPLEAFDGRTGNGMAYYSYLYFKSQDKVKEETDRSVYNQGRTYPNNRFGLRESTVGEDEEKNDFLENIPKGDLTGKKWEAPAEWRLEEVPDLPEMTDAGFLTEGEFVWSDDARGHYVYISKTLRVVITRTYDGSMPLTWFKSDILCDVAAGERMTNVEYSPERALGKKKTAAPHVTAGENKLVFATNADYYTYRVKNAGGKLIGRNGHPVGVIIRNGEVYFDDRYDHDEEKYFPNLDTLAFYEDGRADVHHSFEQSAKDYLADGAYLVYSFGPYLVREGQMSAWVLDPTMSKAKNPRHCFGMVEPGHYIDIMCEGRLGSRSEGVTMPQLAILAQGAGCREVCNLDGGQTAAVIFMGHQLNLIDSSFVKGSKGYLSGRESSEVLSAGVSELVGSWKVQ